LPAATLRVYDTPSKGLADICAMILQVCKQYPARPGIEVKFALPMQASFLKRRPEILFAGALILGLLTLALLFRANLYYSIQNPGGSDLLPRWVGVRKFLMEGVSPYSEETTREIHQKFYGRPARADEDQVLFVYPLYSVFVFGPFAMIPDFDTARAAWMTVLEVAVILLAALSLMLSRWKLSPLMLGLLLLFASLWYYSVRPLINANASLLIAVLVAAAFLALRADHDALAGFLLALSTIKPQMVVLLIAFTLLWSVSTRRYVLFWSTVGSIALFSAITALLIPNWIWQNMVQIVAYPDYTLPTTPGEIFTVWMPGVGARLGIGLTVVMAATLIWEWRLAWGKDITWYIWTAFMTLTITQLIGIPTATENYMILFPALVMVFNAWDEQWGRLGYVLIYFSMALLFGGVWWLFISTLDQLNGQPIQSSILFFPLPVFLLIGLYWVRWWVLRPEQPLLDRFRRFRSRA
jgi:hypothetical protein